MSKLIQAEIEKMFKKLIPNYMTFKVTERRDNPYFVGYTLLAGQVYTQDGGVFDFSLPVCDKT